MFSTLSFSHAASLSGLPRRNHLPHSCIPVSPTAEGGNGVDYQCKVLILKVLFVYILYLFHSFKFNVPNLKHTVKIKNSCTGGEEIGRRTQWHTRILTWYLFPGQLPLKGAYRCCWYSRCYFHSPGGLLPEPLTMLLLLLLFLFALEGVVAVV